MNEELKKALELAITFCANQTAKAKASLEALQYTQAAVNAANALSALTRIDK